MWIIIDGYNLIRRSPSLAVLDREDLQAGREGLLQMLATYQRRRGHRITIVFDGREGGFPVERREKRGGLMVIFSKRGESADEVIKRLSSPGAVVVTSDREIVSAVERAGAMALNAEAFMVKMEEALYFEMKGVEAEEEPIPAKGRGPRKRPPKAIRRREEVLKKL